jgi:hypothetical protein
MPRIIRRLQNIWRTCAFVFFVAYFICVMFVSGVNAATIQSKSCAIDHVQSAVNSSARGDTVIVPSGNCTWTTSLNINKAITLQGEGINNTIIIGKINSTNTYMININPSNPSSDSDILLRVTGFTFKAVDTPNVRTEKNEITYYWRNGGIKLYMGNDVPVPVKKVRIDNNKFIDFVSRSNDRCNLTIYVVGTFYGVVDNNIFDGDTIIALGHSKPWYRWNNTTFKLGTAENFYFEDNEFIKRPIFYYMKIHCRPKCQQATHSDTIPSPFRAFKAGGTGFMAQIFIIRAAAF